MSRNSSRDEPDQVREQDRLGGMVLSQGRSGSATPSGSGDTEQSTGHLNGDAKRSASLLRGHPADLGANGRASRSRDVLLVRDHAYSVSPAERALLTDVGKFRTVAVSDLLRYRELFGRLESLQVLYVSTEEGMFAKAERIFRRLCGKLAAESARVPSDPDLGRLLGHFRARVLLERRETTCFDKQQLDRLRDELQEFRGPEHEDLYQLWREQGDGAVLPGTHGVSTGSGSFGGYRLGQDYGFFGPLAWTVPASDGRTISVDGRIRTTIRV